jgi:hypothetical protein
LREWGVLAAVATVIVALLGIAAAAWYQAFARIEKETTFQSKTDVSGLLEILDFPARFLTLETMVERSLFRLIVPVFPTTSMVAVGLLNTGKNEKNEWIVGDRRG